MPPKACCCKCYTYLDEFIRDGANVELLEPDWQVCDDWLDWELSPNGVLTNTVADPSIIVLKHMVGNPVGIFEADVEPATGDIHRIYAFKGSQVDPCGSGYDYLIEVEWTDPTHCTGRIIRGGTTITEETGILSDGFFKVCVNKDSLYALVGDGVAGESSGLLSVCGEFIEPVNYWFAIGAGSEGTKWLRAKYSDHKDHKPSCPNCGSLCFLNGKAIVGFEMTLSGVENNVCLNCPTADTTVNVMVNPDLDECSRLYESEDVSVEFDCEGPVTPGGPTNASLNFHWDIDCYTNPEVVTVNWQVTLTQTPFGDPFQISKDYDTPANVESITFSLQPSDTPIPCDPEHQCCWADATLTVTPIIRDDCCYDPEAEPAAIAATSAISRKKKKMEPEVKAKWINWVKWFKKPEDRGVGDTVERLLAKIGGRSIKKILMHLGQDCGCTNRQKWLNARYPYE